MRRLSEPAGVATSCALSLIWIWPLAWNVMMSPARTVMPVSVQRCCALTRNVCEFAWPPSAPIVAGAPPDALELAARNDAVAIGVALL